MSVGSAIMGPLARWLISMDGWRSAMLVLGEVVWLVIIPTAVFVREPPVSTTAAGHADTDGADGREL